MTSSMLINGVRPDDLSHAIAAGDRGFHYGDGLFETALVEDGQVRFVEAHLRRLFDGCARLGIPAPDRDTLLSEIGQVVGASRSGVLKIIVSRGDGTRGYRPSHDAQPTRLVALYALPATAEKAGIALRWCTTRLGRNARLAGIKHLNRLEQVLAQAEWDDARIDEGLMLDTEGELVCATAGNIFIVRDGTLVTPDLRFCGVRGVMRSQVLVAAAKLGIASSEEPLWPHDLEAASEVLVTSAVRGVRPVSSLDALHWHGAPVALRLKQAIEH